MNPDKTWTFPITMTITIILNRSCPSSSPIIPNSLVLPNKHTNEAFQNGLVTSLSGPIDDYIIKEMKDNTIDITAKLSYLDRFRRQTQQTKSFEDEVADVKATVARLEARLEAGDEAIARGDEAIAHLEDAEAKRDQMESYAQQVLSSVHLYKIIGQAAESECWASLPRRIKRDLMTPHYSFLPRLFGIWWIIWNSAFPDRYPLPIPLLRNVQLLAVKDKELARSMMHNNRETTFGITVRRAWEATQSELGRLMLYCWAFRKESVDVRNCIAHPKPTISYAKEQIMEDFRVVEYGHLGAFAAEFVDRHPGSFWSE